MRDSKGRFKKGYVSPHKDDSDWVNSGSFKKGHKFGKKSLKKMSDAKKGKKGNIESLLLWQKDNEVWNKGKKTGSLSLEHRKKIGKANSGKNSHLWRGGITSKNMKIRTSFEYKLWRTAVFTRDDYICQGCGQRGGILHADHIKPFSKYPQLRFIIDNGRTLCINCHKETDTYLYKARKAVM